jgi:hypothetical protein
MNEVERRLARLKALRTELRSLGLEGAAEEVGDEISSLEELATDGTAAAYAEAVLELEKGLIEAERRGGGR